MEIFLPAREPFRFDLALKYLKRSHDEVLDVVHGDRYRRAMQGPDGPVLVEATAAEAGVTARVLAGTLPEETLACQIQRQFQLDYDRTQLPADDPFAGPLVEQFQGLPVVQTATPFEAMVWAILGQQINIAFAYKLKRRFVENYGEQVDHDGHTYYLFPTPDRIVMIDTDDLREIQFSRQKTRYIVGISQAIIDGELDFEEAEQLDDEDALALLQKQIGIGRWTAEYVLMRGLGRRDVIPAGDMGLRSAVGVFQGLPGNASEQAVRDLAESWRPYRGDIAFRCWFGFQHGMYKRGKQAAVVEQPADPGSY
ncbi:MAG: DNA-3-methyladenine glycosylase 2 [Chloroflexia bacterium]|nr:DNA-3-methyladenine glycosylase 2 [Chloroflexia bacterium]